MAKFVFYVLALVLLVATSASAHTQLDFGKLATDIKNYVTDNTTEAPATENRPLQPLLSGTVFGANDGAGDTFRDAVQPGEKVRGVTIRTGERVNGVSIIHQDLFGKPETLTNDRGSGAYGREDDRKSIFFIKLTSNLGNSISGGTPTSDIGTETAQEGYQLGGFVGSMGDEIESIGAIWATINA